MNATAPHFFRILARYAAGLRAVHEEIRAERMINDLPARLRKDIGWPDAYPQRRFRR